MIVLENIRKSFNGVEVLKSISATFQPGKVNMIIGASGSGKSVLMKCMVGIIEPNSGAIYYDEQNFIAIDKNAKKTIRQQIGMLFQGSALFDSMTVENNILFPLRMFRKNMPRDEMMQKINASLKDVGLEGANKKFAGELSGGMKKRVGIARAIILNPKYLYVDEPNSGLDPLTSLKIDDLIVELTQKYNTTTIVNTHDMNSVMEIGDYILFIHKGEKCWEGDKKSILTTDNETLNQFVFSSVFMKNFRDQSNP